MSTKMYIIRHCEAEGNVKRIFQGGVDLDISDTGRKQLEFLGKRFKNIAVDAVYSSPLIRAMKTAHSVADSKGLDVIPFADLIEVRGGVIDGKPIAESFKKIPGLAYTWDNCPQDFCPEGGEPMREAYERIWNAVLEIAKQNKGKNTAVATHGGVIRCLMCRIMFNDINFLKDVEWSENTAVSLVEFDDDLNAQIVFSNDRSHVPDEYMPKRNKISEFMRGDVE